MELFHELILISIGKRDALSRNPSESEWETLYKEAVKQSLVGVLLFGIEKTTQFYGLGKTPFILYQWIGDAVQIETLNKLVTTRTVELSTLFSENGIRCCVLKGQGIALLYPNSERRQCGDIDLWVEGERGKILEFVCNSAKKVGPSFIHHIDAVYFDDVPTEIHINPSYSYNPIRFRRYKRFFNKYKDECFENVGPGFCYPSNRFNAVFLLLHIYRHVFNEGIGLRQLMDYYYCLINLTDTDRSWAMDNVKHMGLSSFASAVMYVEREVFEIEENLLLCRANPKTGSLLLKAIFDEGNFGKYSVYNQDKNTCFLGKHATNILYMRRLLSFFYLSPSEVLWAPFFKLTHWVWRKVKGY